MILDIMISFSSDTTQNAIEKLETNMTNLPNSNQKWI